MTMGGVDVTSSAYSNGVITISEVIGDIVITANATVKPNYTNLADPTADGWVNNSRLSSSGTDKGEGGYAGGVVTNWIECKRGDVLRFKGIDFLSDTTAPYMAVKFVDIDTIMSADINSFEAGFPVENGITTFTVYSYDTINQHITSNGEVERIRFSGMLTADSAEDVIITKNEVIS